MIKKHEKLVEEIATTINKWMAVYHPKLGLVYGKIHKDTATKMAKSFITLVLSAFRDGMPLPGEKWRAQAWIEDGHDGFPRGRAEVRPPIGALKGFPRQQAFDVIALRKEEG